MRLAVAVLLLAALAMRLALVIATPDLPLRNDPADYDRLGQLLASGGGFGDTRFAAGGGPTALRPPLYPLFIAGIYKVAGHRVNLVRGVQALVGTLTVALIGLLALLLFGARVGLIALALAAFYPPLWMAGDALVSESIFLPLELGAFLAALEYRRRRRAPSDAEAAEHGTGGRPDAPARGEWHLPAIAGVLGGLAILARPTGVVLLPPLALLMWLPPRLSLKAVAAPMLVLAVAAATLVPWSIRNYRAFDALVPVATLDGFVLAGTYNSAVDQGRGVAYRAAITVPEFRPLFVDRSLDEHELSVALRSEAVRYARRHPGYIAEVGVRSTARLLDIPGPADHRRAAAALGYGPRLADAGLVAWYLVAALALVGAATRAARTAPKALWLAPLLVWASTVIALGTTRYRAPIEPFALLLAALGAQAIVRRLTARTSP